MRALRLTGKTSLTDLTLSEVADPIPQPGEVLIRLAAAALNHRDLHLVHGRLEGSCILGSDGAGVIAETNGVAGWQADDEVLINPSLAWGDQSSAQGDDFNILGVPRDGTIAEYIAVPAENVFARPDHLTNEEAAALPLAGLTAYRALFTRGNVMAGEKVLIHGIGGGVALLALLMAKAAGALVMVTSRAEEKLHIARNHGADAGINARERDWVEEALKWTDGHGVDVVIESIGGDYINRSMTALRLGGRLVSFGRSLSTEAQIDVGTLFWNQLTLLGTTMGSPADFEGMLAFVKQQNIKPVIDSVRPVEEVGAALRHLDAARQIGKVVLAI
jgi:zinc-binding alcohol dehydrogenase/oxidoreductase